jgi:dTDP-4-amino-4,6-dideoxygalactose transaminase
MNIPFNKPYMTGKELGYISQAHARGHLAGDGAFTKQCNAWLERRIGSRKALLTHSCTAALEMAAILADLQPGDEVIMPSFTFVSTANAFVLRGGVPVFVDIRPDTLNIDETKIDAAVTARTRAIVVVHYAGVGCAMDAIMEAARRHNLLVIEDAAQGIMSTYKGHPLGAIGHLATVSFHETKNIISGEGGALLVNAEQFMERAEIIREKGTNRSQFFRGQVDKYTWVDLGS